MPAPLKRLAAPLLLLLLAGWAAPCAEGGAPATLPGGLLPFLSR
jgi:hypothetical protein